MDDQQESSVDIDLAKDRNLRLLADFVSTTERHRLWKELTTVLALLAGTVALAVKLDRSVWLWFLLPLPVYTLTVLGFNYWRSRRRLRTLKLELHEAGYDIAVRQPTITTLNDSLVSSSGLDGRAGLDD